MTNPSPPLFPVPQDDDTLAGRAPCEHLSLEHVARVTAGILHQDEARHLARDGLRIERSDLFSREDQDHDSRMTTAAAMPASWVMLTCHFTAPACEASVWARPMRVM